MDLRKAALIAAIILGLVRCNWIVGQVRLLAATLDLRWIYIVSLVCNVLFLVPLPVLLGLVYTTGATPIISGRLRHLALATALVQATLITTPGMFGVLREVQRDLINVRLFGAPTLAASLWGWLQTRDAGTLASGTLILLSQLAFLLFLIALARQESGAVVAHQQPAPSLRTAALAAVLVGGLAVILNMGQQVYAAVEFSESSWPWLGTVTRGQFIFRNASSGLPGLCWAMAAWIVYKGVSCVPESTPTE
jgi:hypothetical protein